MNTATALIIAGTDRMCVSRYADESNARPVLSAPAGYVQAPTEADAHIAKECRVRTCAWRLVTGVWIADVRDMTVPEVVSHENDAEDRGALTAVERWTCRYCRNWNTIESSGHLRGEHPAPPVSAIGNPFLALADALVAATAVGAPADVEATLTAVLPDGAKHAASLLRRAVQDERRRPYAAPLGDPRGSTVWNARRRVIGCGITPGHPVALVTFYRQSGSAIVQGFFVAGCGAPSRGDHLDAVTADCPGAVARGDHSARTTTDVEALLPGWRIITHDEAATQLAAAGYRMCADHDFLHPLTPTTIGADTWRPTDPFVLTAFAVRA